MSDIQNLLQYTFKDAELLRMALTHKSYYFETKSKSAGHNEKLEFLGDAVVDLAMSQILMEKFPDDDEGHLSKKRASLVNEGVLAKIATEMGLAQFMIMGRGELSTGGDKKPRLLASAFEALTGALFLDGGFPVAKSHLEKHFEKLISELNPEYDFAEDFKTRLQEVVQSEFKTAPLYRVVSESGPSHDRRFEIEVVFADKVLGKGNGRSKKAAEQEAAKEALAQWTKTTEMEKV